MIVGLAGYARSGKDSAADALQSIGFRRIAFADKLREFVYALNPVVDGGPMGEMKLQEVIDRWGWDGYKDTYWGDAIREYMQFVGTDCVRDILGENIWAQATFDVLEDGVNYVVTDVRFPNEADGIVDLGGKVFCILREGIEPANGHTSETALDHYEFDGFIHNDGTLEDLHKSVVRRVNEPSRRN